MKLGPVTLLLMASLPTTSLASCEEQAKSVNEAMAKAGPHRQISHAVTANGNLLTVLKDVVPPDRIRRMFIGADGRIAATYLVIGDRVWHFEKDGTAVEQAPDRAKKYAQSYLIDATALLPTSKLTQCSDESDAEGRKLLQIEWIRGEASAKSSTMENMAWADEETHRLLRLRTTSKNEKSEVEWVSESTFSYASNIEISAPGP